jgi:hypothetical protein
MQDTVPNLTVYQKLYSFFSIYYKRLQNIEKSSDIYVQDIAPNFTVYLCRIASMTL